MLTFGFLMVKEKAFGFLITAVVIALLVVAGPVNALTLGLDGFRTTPYSFNDLVEFTGQIEVNSDELVDVKNVSVEVNDVLVCTFDVYGNFLSNCSGFNVSLISVPVAGYGYGYQNFDIGWSGSNNSVNAGNYDGYGYGYGYGFSNDLEYNISIETPQDFFSNGNNRIKLVAQTSDQLFNSRIENIVIQPPQANNGNGGNSGGNGNGGGSSSNDDDGRRNPFFTPLNGNNGNNNNNGNNLANQILSNVINSPPQGNNGNSALITGNVIGNSGNLGKYALFGVIGFLVIVGILSYFVYRKRNSFKESYNFYR